MITVTGQATFDDYLRAQRYHSRQHGLTISLTMVVFAIFFAVSLRDYFLSGILLLYVAVRPIYMRWRWKRIWQQTPSAHGGPQTYQMDENGFHMPDSEVISTATHWDKFLKSKESKDAFFLYLSPHMFLFLPKRFIDDTDQEEIRQILSEKIQPLR